VLGIHGRKVLPHFEVLSTQSTLETAAAKHIAAVIIRPA